MPGRAFSHIPALPALLAALLALAPALLPAQVGEDEAGTTVDRGASAGAADDPARSRLAVGPGKPFTVREVPVLAPGSSVPRDLSLEGILGSRPILLVYLKMGHGVSEEIYLEVQSFIEEGLSERVELFPVAYAGSRAEISGLRRRMELLGITRPLILDTDQRVQYALKMHHAPHIALIHSDGNLAFSGARSLKHPVYGEMTVAGAVRLSASGERPPSRELWRYYPANDLVGGRFPEVSLPAYDSGRFSKISEFVEPGKLTALFYWSPACRYSRGAMPALAVALKAFSPRYLNLVTVARDGRDGEIRQALADAGLEAPVLRNRGKRFTTKYRVISTPTLILIRPDGIVDGVYTSGKVNLFPVISTRIKSLILDPVSSSPGSAGPSSG